MELEQLNLILTGDYDAMQKAFQAESSRPDYPTLKKQYEPAAHDITDKAKRPDKLVETDQGASVVPVARLPIPLQKKIVNLAVTFLCGRPIALFGLPKDQQQKDLLGLIQRTWDDNKLDYDTQELARILFSETEAAELWYVEEVGPDYWKGSPLEGKSIRLRMRILANSYGDRLDPVFNAAGDMIAFGRGYTVVEGSSKIEHYDTYTEDRAIYGSKASGAWVTEVKPNPVKKIPVVYYRRPGTEWQDVHELINRLERLISNHGDTNDYFGSPMVLVNGTVKGFAKKGEQGKVLELENNASASYLSWDNSPESVKLEMSNLRSLIFDMTDTPDISFENMKGIGTYSGIALRMLFMGAHMKASSNEQVFGKGVQRRINFIKAAISFVDLSFTDAANRLNIKPRFEYFVPKDIDGEVNTLLNASGIKPILSQQTAIRLNPLVADPDAELKLVQDEAAVLAAQQLPAVFQGTGQ